MPIWAFLAQAATAPTDGAGRLSALSPACPAGPSADGTIVVCGRQADQRLRPLPVLPEKHVDPASFRLPGGGAARLHAIQSELPGAAGQGAAVTFTVPLGRSKKPDASP